MAENKCAKEGRNKAECKVYRDRGRRERNACLRALRTLRRQPNNEALEQTIATWRKSGRELAWRDACRVYLSETGGGVYAQRHVTECDKATA